MLKQKNNKHPFMFLGSCANFWQKKFYFLFDDFLRKNHRELSLNGSPSPVACCMGCMMHIPLESCNWAGNI
jgi:hypothetical protein